ncbi:hypothetical protein LCGC14_1703700 [marine sediment metagenome]|uniref:Uncharacterized protein n=1 Tax=marine sediment metagenome TaxID=412755 RepID=A0A0F9KH97_9ZZZZ
MPELKANFRGLNTTVYPDRLPSGQADVALNVQVKAGDLQKRPGFAEFEADVTGAADGVLNLFLVPFADGDTYIVAKMDNRELWQRKVGPTDAGSFTQITTSFSHDSSDRGWGFMWADNFHYIDRAGVSRWNPDVNSGTAYRGGQGRPGTGPLIASAAGGEKEGRYHVHAALRNSVTREEGVITAAQTGSGMPLECRVANDTGGIAISNWTAIKAADTEFDADEVVFYCTLGNSEMHNNAESFSYRAYVDVIAKKTQTSVGLNKADHVLDATQICKNSGGIPPGAQFGAYNGVQAFYGGLYNRANASLTTSQAGDDDDLVYTAIQPGTAGNAITVQYSTSEGVSADSESSTVTGVAIVVQIHATSTADQVKTAINASSDTTALVTVADKAENDGTGVVGTMGATNLTGGTAAGNALVGSRIDFSIPNYPCMVPSITNYTIGGDAKTFFPKPWIGSIPFGIPGTINCIAAGGGVTLVFTPISTYKLNSGSDGRAWPLLVSETVGCAGPGAAIGTPQGIYVLGHGKFSRIGRDGLLEISFNRIETTLAEIPVAQQSDANLAHFAHENEIWMAVTQSGETVAQRLLIYDYRENEFVIYEPTCLGASEAITCMVELKLPNAAPTMLFGTDAGKIFKLDTSVFQDDGTGYACQWRGYFGQERIQFDQRLEAAKIHTGANCEGNVTISLRPMRTGGETITQTTHTLGKNNLVEKISAELDVIDANLFQIEFSSLSSVSSQWKIRDLVLSIDRTDKK